MAGNRGLHPAATVACGPLLVGVVFRIPALSELIPASLVSRLEIFTGLLGLTLGLAVAAYRSSPQRFLALPRGLRAAATLALPFGLGLLVWCQSFVVRVPSAGGRMISEVVAPPRPPGCCAPGQDDAACLRYSLSLDPLAIEKCWGSSRVQRNRLWWSIAFLLSAGGILSLAALPWCRAPGRPPATGPAQPVVRSGLFLSYAREDQEFAGKLARDLTDRGISVWWDQWEMGIGDLLPRSIEEAIARSRWFGIVLSPEAVSSRWVRTELDLALTLDIEEEGMTILPLLLRPCEVPLSLRRMVWADFTASYESGFEALLRALAAESSGGG